MLQTQFRGTTAPPIHALWPNGQAEEAGRPMPAAKAVYADFSRPLGQAQATMRKIAAAAAEAGASQNVARGAQIDLRA